MVYGYIVEKNKINKLEIQKWTTSTEAESADRVDQFVSVCI